MSESMLAAMSSAFLLGLLGSGHCLGMCGGIAGALGQFSSGPMSEKRWVSSLLYSLGRVSSYAMLGAVAGGLGASLGAGLGVGPWMRVVAGALIVAFGIQTLGWARPSARLEEVGRRLWRRMSPLVARVGLPPTRAWQVLVLGGLWGFLPCGLVYSALAASSLVGSALAGAGFMLLFGIGTLPAMFFVGGTANSLVGLLRGPRARQVMGAMLVVFGLWTLGSPLLSGHSAHGVSHDQGAHSMSH